MGRKVVKTVDLVGTHQENGRLKAIRVLSAKDEENTRGKIMLIVQCDCGSPEFDVVPQKFKTEHTKSCGCLAGNGRNNPSRHGETNEPWYWSWKSMLKRTQETTHVSYEEYKDVYVDPRYLTDPWAYFNDIEGEKLDKTYSVDRIDPTKGYEPGNMRWASKVIQSNNRRGVHEEPMRHIYTQVSRDGVTKKYSVAIERNGERIYKLFPTLEEAQVFRDELLNKFND